MVALVVWVVARGVVSVWWWPRRLKQRGSLCAVTVKRCSKTL